MLDSLKETMVTPAVLFGPQEVMVIVVFTAIIVLFLVRGRRKDR